MSQDGIRGRGAAFNPPNRFQRQELVAVDVPPPADDDLWDGEPPATVPTLYLRDATRTIFSTNDSPDLPFRVSLNPYRGCEHGCIYCYARPGHEFLGFSAGVDFESRIVVKMDAAALVDAALRRRSWQPEVVCLSGVTDCYQPVERALKLTRACLAVFAAFQNPVCLITKNALVARDVDILGPLARRGLATVAISLTTLDAGLARRLEPRASTPARRLHAMRALADAGVPVSASIAPVIPGLTDEELPALVAAAAAAGASSASFTVLRLPGAVEPLFCEWLRREYPERESKVLGRLRDVRGGELHDGRPGSRMKGSGDMAAMLDQLFDRACRRVGLTRGRTNLRTDLFAVPPPDGQQLLFPSA